ncbi:MAG: hypothetical protein GQ557_00010 [Mycoplasmataceae bacterium]|nr:hypothetical protein [Mycoplasmataceae bacterium]
MKTQSNIPPTNNQQNITLDKDHMIVEVKRWKKMLDCDEGLEAIWGVGPITSNHFKKNGLKTVEDVANIPGNTALIKKIVINFPSLKITNDEENMHKLLTIAKLAKDQMKS